MNHKISIFCASHKHTATKTQTAILWGLFTSVALAGIIYLANRVLGNSYPVNPLNGLLDLSLLSLSVWVFAVLLLLLHVIWTLGNYRGCAFLLVALSTSFLFEIIGVNRGIFFGGSYHYHSGNMPAFLGVPLLIPIIWSAFIYTGYSITTSFLHWLNMNKPNKLTQGVMLLPLLVLFDGLIVVAIDLLMEPLQVAAGNWAWLDTGSYFNIPLGNFVVWFAVAVISTGAYRVFEYMFPRRSTPIDRPVFLIPLIGYGLLCLALVSIALRLNLPDLALIGLLTMFPVVIANICLFIRWKKTGCGVSKQT
jgi:uncharacterized membrane protein